MDDRLTFPVRQPRPDRLHNEGCCYSDEVVAEILRKADHDLICTDYRVIFAVSRCVGTFEEKIYFLPMAFRYVLSDDENGHECVSEIVHFISHEVEALRAERLLHSCRSAVRAWLDHWTRRFVVISSRSACERCGGHEYHHVEDSDVLTGLLDDLLSCGAHACVAEEFIESLACANNPTASAWFLEYARQTSEAVRYHDSGESTQTWRQVGRPMLAAELEKLWPALDQLTGEKPQVADRARQAMSFLESVITKRNVPAESSPLIVELVRSHTQLQRCVESVKNSKVGASADRCAGVHAQHVRSNGSQRDCRCQPLPVPVG